MQRLHEAHDALRIAALGLFDPKVGAAWMLRREGQESPSWQGWATERAPLLPSEGPFLNAEWVRGFALERNCVAYFDVVRTEEEIEGLEAALSQEAWRA